MPPSLLLESTLSAPVEKQVDKKTRILKRFWFFCFIFGIMKDNNSDNNNFIWFFLIFTAVAFFIETEEANSEKSTINIKQDTLVIDTLKINNK